ncbi:MAG: acyl-CoA dehydrogenase family protein [Crocosphaera sp.]|nr:acyl-CoA dehydrogenase family protein [Crocosphaera sp.]
MNNNFLEKVEAYLKEYVVPHASEIDQFSDALKIALQGLMQHSLNSVRIPKSWGGLELDAETFYLFQQLLSQYSGALAFLQLQHQGAIRDIINSQNEELKEKYISHVINDKQLIGQGFSQLRRKGKPMIVATPVEGGYQINGHVPWITGYDFFDVFILGANLENGQEIRGIVSFNSTNKLQLSDPMKLGAMSSTNTVTATFEKYFLPAENVVSIAQIGAIHQNDKKVVLYPSFLILGCAKAGLDIVKGVADKKQLDFIDEAYQHLHEELIICQTKVMKSIKIKQCSFEDHLQLRVWAINLAQRCTKAAVTVSSGAANYYHHPAQRVYKEALVFSVFAQTTDIMKASLEQLVYN